MPILDPELPEQKDKRRGLLKTIGWWLFENIPMGKLAPYFFGWLIGKKPIKKQEETMPELEFELKPAWANFISDNGDIDVVPLGEEHEKGTGKCKCEPTVQVIGSNILTTHNSFDMREFIEQAIAIMNGDDNG